MSSVEFKWREIAACRDADTALFFQDENQENSMPAKAICAACPVREECLNYAFKMRQEDGVWGGLTPDERRSVMRRRARAKRNGFDPEIVNSITRPL